VTEPRFVLSPRALSDLQGLESYITDESGAQRAEAVIARIYRLLNMLAYWPKAGPIHKEIEGNPRTFAISPWIVFYEPSPELDGIHVLRVLDGRRDLGAIFPLKTNAK
jgi:toxin ParE1/3/4